MNQINNEIHENWKSTYIDETREEVICVHVKLKLDKWRHSDWCCNFCHSAEPLRPEHSPLHQHGGLISNKSGKGHDQIKFSRTSNFLSVIPFFHDEASKMILCQPKSLAREAARRKVICCCTSKRSVAKYALIFVINFIFFKLFINFLLNVLL